MVKHFETLTHNAKIVTLKDVVERQKVIENIDKKNFPLFALPKTIGICSNILHIHGGSVRRKLGFVLKQKMLGGRTSL